MKKATVEVCVCTECVMRGAMEITESIESLQNLESDLDLGGKVEIVMNKCIGEPRHGADSPVVKVNGELLQRADSETVMEKILNLVSEG